MSARAGLRFVSQSTRQTAFRRTQQQIFRRHQTTATNPAVEGAPSQNIFQRLWTSEVGVKTVHFWAPVMKWGVVIAGASDFFRPAEKLSLTQNAALMATGSIWTRWCFVIRPKNMLLAAVNFCLFLVGSIQTARILAWQSSQQGSLEGAVKELGEDVKATAKSTEAEAVADAKKVKAEL